MWSSMSLGVFLLVLAGGQALPNRFETEAQNVKIIGGQETTIEAFPYQVAMDYYGLFKCGGSVLSENVILTAAHCLYKVFDESKLTVRAGSSLHSSGGQVLRAARTLYHPDFSWEAVENDVGLVKLDSLLWLSAIVRPVQLVDVGVQLSPGQTVTVSGWGVTQEDDFFVSDVLRTVQVKVVRRWLCSIPYIFSGKITNAMFCASGRGKDACQGDSGGPVVNEEGKQVGIVSFGNGCAHWLFPGVYTNLADANIRQFIDESLKEM